jgi:capsular exopolysaccharide synthesis family protein
MNVQQTRMPQIKKPLGLDYYVQHYLNLIWRCKWYICLVTPTVAVLWVVLALNFGYRLPSQEARVTLQFIQGNSNMGPIDYQTITLQKESCDAFLHSRPFLQTIVEKLSLQVSVKNYFRQNIFDSILVDKNAPFGQYDFIVEKDGYTLYFSNKMQKIKKRPILSGKLFELNAFDFQSVRLVLTHEFIATPHSVTFFIYSTPMAVERLTWYLSSEFPGAEDRTGDIMVICLRGTEYPLITRAVNMIADDFVLHNESLQRNSKSDAVNVLEKQVQSAKAELDGAEFAMRQFREANPSIGPSSGITSSMAEVSSIDISGMSLKRAIDDGAALQARCTASPSVDDQITAMYEAITYLQAHQSVAAVAMQIELNEVAAQKHKVDADYAPQHPLAVENRRKVARLVSNVSKSLEDVLDKMRTDLASATIRKGALSEEFRKLPSKELRYAELERKRTTLMEMYSSMLARYNSNKMSLSSQGGEVAVLDRAVVPMPPGKLQAMSKLLLMGLAVALGIGFGPPAGLDYLDKRARNEGDCRRLTSLPYLEGIPNKEGGKGKKKKADKEKLDERLVAAGFEPSIFDEMYRSLRTKILLHLYKEPHKMLVVTSLNAGEGKSLTASNLSIVMAQQKLRTLIVDGDLRRGVQHHSFVLEKSPGLSEILSSPDDLTTLPVNAFIQKTHIPNLSLLSCGMPIPNPAECMNSDKFRDLTTILAEWFDVVILDTPPLRAAVDAAILPEAFNHYVIVARTALTNIEGLEKKIMEFHGLSQKVLGIVLNGAPIDKEMHNHVYSYYRR